MATQQKPKPKPTPKPSKTEAEAIDRLRIAVEDLACTVEFVGLHLAAQIDNLPTPD